MNTRKSYYQSFGDDPVEQARKAGPQGNGEWPGFDYVYRKITEACEAMAQQRYVYLSNEHIETMADLGSGHEERMKCRLMWLRARDYI